MPTKLIEAVSVFASPVFTGRGRISRTTYWIGLLGITMCLSLLNMTLKTDLVRTGIVSPGAGAIALLIVWSFVAIIVRRGHDLGLPGWASLGMAGVWWSATFASPITAFSSSSPILTIAAMILLLSPFMLLGGLAGDPVANLFGEPEDAPGRTAGSVLGPLPINE